MIMKLEKNKNYHATTSQPQQSFFPFQSDSGHIKTLKSKVKELEKIQRKYEKRDDMLRSIDINNTTPKQAFDILWNLIESQKDN